MQQRERATEIKTRGLAEAGLAGTGLERARVSGTERKRVEAVERKRVEAVVETLANLRSQGESLAEVAHDARNMVTALGLYCDLLEEPGVLNPTFHHYASELRLVATASRRLVEKLLALDARLDARIAPVTGLSSTPGTAPTGAEAPGDGRLERARRWELLPPEPINNLAEELLANRNLLSALAGPSIILTMDVEGGALPVRLTGEDLTRILVNLVKNAAEAMSAAGRIAFSLHEFHAGAERTPWLLLTIEDSGPGIPVEALEKIFDSGYTTRESGATTPDGPGPHGWPASHRGLGLSITRSIVEAAGGSIHAVNRAPAGACFKIELPGVSR
ncbi:MAG: sensor histidine kinase [Terracidiphilus sp.]|jgi:signal transduction histidine kinase